MKTKFLLARDMREAGIPEHLCMLADHGAFDDCESESNTPAFDLVYALTAVGTSSARYLIEDIKNGKYDATPADWEEWTKKMAGNGTFATLMKHL